MSQEIKNVIVIGASGNLGPYLVDELVNSKFAVSVLTRATSNSAFHENVKVFRTDYSKSSLLEALQGQDVVVSAIATFSTQQQKTIVDAAVKAGIKRFIPSEYGVDTSLPQIPKILPPAQPKVDTVEYLKTKEKSGMSWTGICVGAWFDWVLEIGNGLMGFDIHTHTVTIFNSGDQPYEATNLRQIGRAVVSTLLHLQETENKYIYVNSFTVTQNRVLAALENATQKKWVVKKDTVERLAASGIEKINDGDVSVGTVDVITAAIYGHGAVNNFGEKIEKWNRILGLPDEDLDTVVRGLVEKARA
ncbi:NmrA-like family protein [Glonium stellatum]|uniref:NmrA-like family protein n=1 Tax=Glonium stellatum TaxID=574774 RepID=A0A8E2FDN9_9PEZI|nr:NmrA-like family protein [Glonium stellatum]